MSKSIGGGRGGLLINIGNIEVWFHVVVGVYRINGIQKDLIVNLPGVGYRGSTVKTVPRSKVCWNRLHRAVIDNKTRLIKHASLHHSHCKLMVDAHNPRAQRCLGNSITSLNFCQCSQVLQRNHHHSGRPMRQQRYVVLSRVLQQHDPPAELPHNLEHMGLIGGLDSRQSILAAVMSGARHQPRRESRGLCDGGRGPERCFLLPSTPHSLQRRLVHESHQS